MRAVPGGLRNVEPDPGCSGPESARDRPPRPADGADIDQYYTRHMETIDGVPVTDEMIQAWADEAERGYNVEVLRAHGIITPLTTPAPFAPSVSP